MGTRSSVCGTQSFDAAALNPEGTLVAAAPSHGGELQFLPVRQEQIVKPRRSAFDENGRFRITYGGDSVHMVAWHPSGQRVAVANGNGTVVIVDAGSRLPVGTVYAHRGVVRSAEWSQDGRWLVTSGSDDSVKIFDGSRYDLLRTIDLKEFGVAYSVALSADSRWLATMNLKGTHIWSIENRRRVIGLPDALFGAWRPVGSELTLAEPNVGLDVWALDRPIRLRSLFMRLFPEP